MISMLKHIRNRRAELRKSIDVASHFEEWEESCVPSYLHGNPLAAYVSWRRLFKAAKMANRFKPNPPRVLDFGSSVGELSHILNFAGDYEFIELDDASANFLMAQNRRARRTTLDEAPHGSFDAVFAIDSLEHNKDFAVLLGRLVDKLAPDGILVLSGPTENALYRLGRRIAGFDGHYHETTIFDIETAAGARLRRVAVSTLPFGLPLFRVTVWKKR